MSVREVLAEAASTVDDVACSPYYQQLTGPGHGVVRLDGSVRDDSGFGWIDTWQVLVFLPQDLGQAEVFAESIADPLIDALSPHMVVTSMAPTQLITDQGVVPCWLVEGARERDR